MDKVIDMGALRRRFPQYDELSDAQLLRLIQRRWPQYAPDTGVGIEFTTLGRRPDSRDVESAAEEAAVAASRAQVAASLHEIELRANAANMGVSLETLATMQVVSHQTNEQIRLATHQNKEAVELDRQAAMTRTLEDLARAMNGLEAERLDSLQDHTIIDQLRAKLFAALNALEVLASAPDHVSKEIKMRLLESQIQVLQEDFNGRLRRLALPEAQRTKTTPRRLEESPASGSERTEISREEAE